MDRSTSTVKKVRSITNLNNISSVQGDLGSISQIKEMVNNFYKRYDKLDVLVNNAGVYSSTRKITTEGLEQTFAINYVAPFLLTNLLLNLLKQVNSSRIVNVVSRIHSNQMDFNNLQFNTGYTGVKAYARSKTCLIMFTYFLAEKLQNTGITVNCLHPGVIDTKLQRAAMGGGGGSLSEGAKTLVYASTSPKLVNVSGKYFVNNKPSPTKQITYKKEIQKKLWYTTEEIIGQYFPL